MINRKFLFRCEDCQMIVSIELDEQEDLDKVQDDKLDFECQCGGVCKVLRD